jgi:hypothetical protein
MRADGLDESQRLLGVEIEPAFVSVFDVVEVTPDRQLNVPACVDLAAQNRVAVAADAGCMVSECHAGDVDFGVLAQRVNTVRLRNSLARRLQRLFSRQVKVFTLSLKERRSAYPFSYIRSSVCPADLRAGCSSDFTKVQPWRLYSRPMETRLAKVSIRRWRERRTPFHC